MDGYMTTRELRKIHMDKRQTILIVDDAEFNRDIKKVTPHSCYFSDELGVSNFFIKI